MNAVPAAERRKPDQPSEGSMRLAEHPRARRHISKAKGWGGLVAFVLVGLLSLRAGVPHFEAGLRALLAGAAGYTVAWAAAVLVWRHLAVAEVRAAEALASERRERMLEAQRTRAAAADD
jgi:hypothetical protein